MALKVLPDDSSQPWYAHGLSFSCTGCGKCCTGSPGYVWVSPEEIEQMASYLNLSVEEFSRCYIRRVKGRFSLIEHAKTYDCVFLKDNQCQIYPVRPTQCRTYPWWPQNLKSEKDWQQAAAYCEGIRPHHPTVPVDTIQEQLALQNKTTPSHDSP